jgi:hypothetical protein
MLSKLGSTLLTAVLAAKTFARERKTLFNMTLLNEGGSTSFGDDQGRRPGQEVAPSFPETNVIKLYFFIADAEAK